MPDAPFFTPPVFVAAKPVAVRSQPSRWRLTYGFELQLYSNDGTQRTASTYVNLPVNPRRYSPPMRFATEIKPTMGGVSVEEGGIVNFDFSVAGTCGLAPKQGWSPGNLKANALSGGGIFFADGNTIFRELKRLFEIYDAAVKSDGSIRPRMVWHDWTEDTHWIVVPTSFNFERDAAGSTRMSFDYEIELTYVGTDANPSIPGEAQIVRTVEGIVGNAVGALNFITSFAADAAALITEANGLVTTTTNSVLGAVNALAEAARGIRQGIADTIALPQAVADAFARTVQGWKGALGVDLETVGWDPLSPAGSVAAARYALAASMEDQFDVLLAQPEVFGDTLGDATGRNAGLFRGDLLLSDTEIAQADAALATNRTPQQSFTARATPGSAQRRGALATQVAGRAGATPRGYTGARVYTVIAGDTILGIAQREMGSGDLWPDIAALNNLVAPYISPLGLVGTVRPGASILIPTNGQQPGAPPKPALLTEAEIAAQVLGTDLKINEFGTWLVDGATGTDYLTVAGVPNFIQALGLIRFRTEVGSNLVFPWLGIFAPIGSPNGPQMPEAIALAIRRAALSDSRTAQVGGFQVDDAGDTVRIDLDVYPRGISQAVAVGR